MKPQVVQQVVHEHDALVQVQRTGPVSGGCRAKYSPAHGAWHWQTTPKDDASPGCPRRNHERFELPARRRGVQIRPTPTPGHGGALLCAAVRAEHGRRPRARAGENEIVLEQWHLGHRAPNGR
jgi:hypothetical protein